MTRLEELKDRRDDAQSQLDALCGENPEESALLIREIAAIDRQIAAEEDLNDFSYVGSRHHY